MIRQKLNIIKREKWRKGEKAKRKSL